jgi:alpha-mannosidase
LVSLYDKKAGREALAAGQFSNDFVVLPDTGNAWDFEIDHEKKDVWGYLRLACERPVLKEAATQIDGPCASLLQVWTFRSSEIRQTIRLFSESAQLEFATEVTWNEPATMLRVRFAASAQADEARFEIPFGHISRSTHDVTIHQRAQLEVAAHQWVDLSDGRHGLALLNDCKYGFRVKGSVIDMSLIRSVPFPGAPLIAKGDQSTGAEVTPFTDLGKHEFGYALLPHTADFGPAEITRAAREFNIKPTVVVPSPEVNAARPACAEVGSVLIGSPAIEVVAIKRAEDRRGWIIRLVNLTERAVDTPVALWPGVKEVAECDLIEATVNAIAINEGRGELRFGPFEIKTLRAM